MKVCLGGTFNIIHRGHELLFERAFENDNQVFIGLTSDDLIEGKKTVDVDDYLTREGNLRSFLDGKGWKGRFTITELKDELGPAAHKDFDAIIVSEETRDGAHAINAQRESNSLEPLKIFAVKLALAETGEIISATKIKYEEGPGPCGF
jgi:pantetheine-phosphate adenylyltransferase